MTKALVVGAFGARGTGKTAWLMRELSRAACLAIWDYKHDPRMASWGTPHASLPAFIAALDQPRFVLRYLVDRTGPMPVDRQFEFFCRACFLRGNMTMFVDELPAVTRAYKAPDAWRECVNIGREYRTPGDRRIKELGIAITAQRLSEVDKSLIGNLDVLHTGRLPYANDAKAAAAALGVAHSTLMQLPDLHFVERRADRMEPTFGVLSFGNAPTKKNSAQPARPKAPRTRTP